MEIGLQDLFFRAFGVTYRPGVYDPGFEPKFPAVSGDNSATRLDNGAVAGTPYYGKDLLGREVYLPITISYPDEGSNSSSLKDWKLPYCIVGVTSRKTIIETALTERTGTVKELINIEDYKINIKGLFINQVGNDFPEADVMLLNKVYKAKVALYLTCALTDIFLGTDKVVIRNINFPEVRGVKHVRAFEIDCVSDEDFNLIDIS